MSYISSIKPYIEISKPRVVLLMIFTSLIGMLLANPLNINFLLLIIANVGIALMAFSAGAINQLVDQKVDRIMDRTKKRPLPSGELKEINVIVYSIVIGFIGFVTLFFYVNQLTAYLTFASLVGYAFIYTMYLKRATPQNIVIGGAAGATPPLLGWTAITGSVDYMAIIMFLIIFMWTPPHFWALALAKKDEYAAAKIPMLPVTHGDNFTRIHITLYTLMMSVCSFLPFLIGFSGKFYLFGSIVLNLFFLYLTISMQISKSNNLSFKIFNYSIIYLSALFGFMIADRYLNLLVIL
ncbi:MAG: protoheme IX farnesyltransferase [Gammaproteobacteria bacterium]|jgi:protoheme IX farnesyltransferase|nr:protoheme IX farnesyltransferase [Gammaproteobacteria bacterium]